jgi:6-methylsalicylate decarboxylase
MGSTTRVGAASPTWDSDGAIGFMDRFEIDLGLLSVSAPGVWVGDTEASLNLARRMNDYGAELAKERPDRFGQLASLPLPAIDGVCVEAARANDELGADGFILLANNAGTYLGDPLYDPLMEILDARHAVVLVHPTTLPGLATRGIPTFAIDFLLDTTRAAANVVLHDVPARFPDIRFILSHAGGFMPYASHRIATLTVAHEFQTAIGHTQRSVDFLLDALSSFYVDTALSDRREPAPSHRPRQRRTPIPQVRRRSHPASTASSEHTWLTRSVLVASATRMADKVTYDLYRLT